ncbi:MAG: hypothetical protein V3571_04325 [Pseudodesulfovibrio sp.]
MRSIVNFDDCNEADIRPHDEILRYIELVGRDIPAFFPESELRPCACPACGERKVGDRFEKLGLSYAECISCGTLYVQARPGADALDRFYRDSAARKYWREELARVSAAKRRDKIVTPRIYWIEDSIREYRPGAANVVVLNADGPVLVKDLGKLKAVGRQVLLHPLCGRDAIPSGIEVVDDAAGEAGLAGRVDALTLFEVADRAESVDVLMERALHLLSPGGLCFITGALASGFDILTLWDRSESLIPPDRLNVLTVKGWRSVFERHGFDCLEFSTPGVLDVEVVGSALAHSPDIKVSRFVRRLMEERDQLSRREFQKFLQANLLSSYGRILLQKK